MPAALLEYSKVTFDDPNKLGDQGGLTRPTDYAFPLWRGGSETTILDYIVPAGKVVDLKNILLMILDEKPYTYNAASATNYAGDGYLDVDGTDKFEGRFHAPTIGVPGTIDWTTNWRPNRNLMSIGEGIDFTTGQVLKLKFLPTSPVVGSGQSYPMKLSGVLHGKAVTGGAVDLQQTVLRTPAPASVVDILSYTVPANGFRLFHWSIEFWLGVPSVTFLVFLNGVCFMEIPYVQRLVENSTFNSNGWPKGVLALMGLGAWGMKLVHGDRITVTGHAMLDIGQGATATLVGKSTTETFPVAGDVKTGTVYGPNETDYTGTYGGGGGGGLGVSQGLHPIDAGVNA